jgi:DNA topoisomerase-3
VQTPVLALIAGRDDEIRTFKPEPFWELLTRYRGVTFKFTGQRFANEADGQELLLQVQGHPFQIENIARKQERIQPPLLYDLTELQRDMNRRYGMSADATLKAAQALYESKRISYPRTDSRYLSSDMKPEIPRILRDLRPIKPDEIAKLDLDALSFTGQIVNDKKVSDHHAIIPTGKHPASLSPGAEKVYDAVVTRLIAVFYPACVKDITMVDGQSNGVPFRARGVRVIEPGWTALYPRRSDDKNEDEQELPEFRSGECGPHEPLLRAGETTPPKHYTENTLLGAMETAGKLVDDEQLKEALKAKGLGTPATRAAIIETLLQRGYIARDKKTLTATDLGRYLVAIVHDRLLRSAELTGEWEAKLRAIENGGLDPRRFMREIVHYTGELIRTGASSTIDESKLGDCPRCGRPVIEGKRGYGCSGWRAGCPFALWKTHKDQPLSVGQIRELLQRRVLLEPIALGGADGVILYLTDSGAVVDITVPSRRPLGETVPKRGRRTASGRERSRARPPASAPVGVAVSFGPCPRCGSEVVEQPNSYRCSGWQHGCKFVIWKTIAGKRIGARTAQALLREGRSRMLKGFRSKAGKPFEARLKVDQGDVRFDFGQA